MCTPHGGVWGLGDSGEARVLRPGTEAKRNPEESPWALRPQGACFSQLSRRGRDDQAQSTARTGSLELSRNGGYSRIMAGSQKKARSPSPRDARVIGHLKLGVRGPEKTLCQGLGRTDAPKLLRLWVHLGRFWTCHHRCGSGEERSLPSCTRWCPRDGQGHSRARHARVPGSRANRKVSVVIVLGTKGKVKHMKRKLSST